MFKSTTLRLTGWYLLILMSVSITFSIIVFQVATSEIRIRLEGFQSNMQKSIDFTPPSDRVLDYRKIEVDKTKANLSLELFYTNMLVLAAGGLGSYYLARRSLRPIEMAHEAQSRFTSDASHELRTPLAVMKTEIEVALLDNDASSTELRGILASNLEEVDKLSKLSEMLLNLSRLEHNKLELTNINLSKITRDIVNDFDLPNNRLCITGKKQLLASGNETAIADLIKILIDNALKYSPADSQITINLSKHDHGSKFQITNIGHGIDPDKIDFIFDRFYRADSSRTGGKTGGHGLGLALAKNIVELHNGELSVDSVVDQKTSFTFILSPIRKKSSKN